MNLLKNTFSRKSKPPSPAIHPPSRKSPSPVDIPEILERIFFFTDDFTLRWIAVLVCRQWFHMNMNRFPRTVYYKSDMRRRRQQPELVVSRLTGATRLCCYLTVDEMSRDIRNPFRSNIRNVIVDSQEEYRKQLEKRNQDASHKQKPSIYSFSPLREMIIDIANYINGSFDTFSLPETLTNVTLHIRSSGNASFNFSRILRHCPLLEMLSIEAIICDNISLTWDEPMTPRRDLALRSFTLYQVSVRHAELERLLSSALRLKALKLIGLISSGVDLTLLCTHIRTLSLDLETFHFSTYDKTLTKDLQQQALEICPVTSEWSLWASDMSLLLLKELEVHTPCLTTLELHWQRKGNFTAYEEHRIDIIAASRLLFEYLCNSPSAVNLRSLKTGVLHHNMDVFGRGQSFDTSDSPALQAPSISPGVWRCRNLQILHINLRDHTSSMRRRVHSRIVFGYIARVAPRLEDLEIYFPYFIVNKAPDHIYAGRLCMQLDGGFCLLGRLRYLQRLKVYAAGGGITTLCRELDLNWILPSGRSDNFKELRQQEIASWQSLRLVEDQYDKAQQQQDDGDGFGVNGGSLDAKVRGQFRNLGLLMDVEETINEIDDGSLVPFPSLTGLSFTHPILQWPDKALDQLFPKPKRRFGLW